MFMRRRARKRAYMLEAFTAGWQAGLAVNITNPRVLEIVESCFDLWLDEAADARSILGIRFSSRGDLPRPARNTPVWVTAEDVLRSRPSERPTPYEAHRQLSTRPFVPAPRDGDRPLGENKVGDRLSS